MGQFVLPLMYLVNQLDVILLLPATHLLVSESRLLALLPHVFITSLSPVLLLLLLSLPPAAASPSIPLHPRSLSSLRGGGWRSWICQSANADFQLSPCFVSALPFSLSLSYQFPPLIPASSFSLSLAFVFAAHSSSSSPLIVLDLHLH